MPGRGASTQDAAPGSTLAFVESPVQLLNVLEWAYADALRAAEGTDALGASGSTDPLGASESTDALRAPADTADVVGTTNVAHADAPRVAAGDADGSGAPAGARAGGDTGVGAPGDLTVIVLSPHDPMTRGQLRRMAELAREEGVRVRWEEARGGASAPFRTISGLASLLRAARRIVIGDPFSRYVQLLLTMAKARDLIVVDDGTATMEFISQLARGERLERWHRRGSRGARDLVFAPVSAGARRRLTPGQHRRVEVFSSMPVDPPPGVTVTSNTFAWTRSRFGPPKLTGGTDLVGTSLVETGVVDLERYVEAVTALTREHGATRYFAHRKEATDKLHRISVEVGLEIVRPDLPLELIARRGPIGRMILSFPSTVVHTLPLALAGTGIKVAVCDVDPAWLTSHASPRAQGFLSGVTGTARDVHRLPYAPASPSQP
ncbi:hypothetical protein [Streptomyces buecherae]|uniref:Uncharacterized protein n=1 Tax=Streptomyces buecherae TaxID=2763006 RepID=A0A7H8NJG5_9ACTN|nr:hypothetical protein [Streptomyces buecherae]QKW54486.1 hypothetical protein HUT08_13210 [Streptomyces buecherae]